jgi:hypothetical protein
MPNGGPDNCSTCGFNRRNRGEWRNPAPDEKQLPFCEIRQLAVLMEHWTYCENWHSRSAVPSGPVYSSGIYEYESGYHRIPWHGNTEPEIVHDGICQQCEAEIQEGISIALVERPPVTFCCNLHYLQWWKAKHPHEQARMSRSIEEP